MRMGSLGVNQLFLDLISCDDDDFPSELPFVFNVAADENFIDIDELVERVGDLVLRRIGLL